MVQNMTALTSALLLLVVPSLSFRARIKVKSDSCSRMGCDTRYNRSLPCQCNNECSRYGNCCSDYSDLCEASSSCAARCGSSYDRSQPCQCNDECERYSNCCSNFGSLCGGGNPAPNPPTPSAEPTPSTAPPTPTPIRPTPIPGPAPPPNANATRYWEGADLSSKESIQARLRTGAQKLSYGALWNFYKVGWVNLPGQEQCYDGIFDVYSQKCWTPGSGQCGSYRKEGDCYNREHSWPKSWWDRVKNSAYSDVFHVVPSDGYVNGKRGSFPFGEVSKPSYTSSEGNKVGPCTTPGYSGTCFEPTDKVKGLMARGHFYMMVRYMNEFSCCGKEAVDGAEMKAWYVDLMLRWNAVHPPQEWETEFNNRAEEWQGNRNPFIDYPQAVQQLFR